MNPLAEIVIEFFVYLTISCIALIKEISEFNKKNIKNYFDVFLDVPIDVLKRRDSKGIYKQYSEGIIQNVYGLDINYDPPISPKMHIKYDEKNSYFDVAEIIYKNLNKFILKK